MFDAIARQDLVDSAVADRVTGVEMRARQLPNRQCPSLKRGEVGLAMRKEAVLTVMIDVRRLSSLWAPMHAESRLVHFGFRCPRRIVVFICNAAGSMAVCGIAILLIAG